MKNNSSSKYDFLHRPLRILLVSQYFYPEVGATQTRIFEFAKNLSRLGHRVTVIGEFPNHPHGIMPEQYKGKWFERESVAGFDVLRVWVFTSPVKDFKTRLLFYLSFMIMAILGSFKLSSRFDVVLATSPPLFVGVSGYVISMIKRSKFVLDIRDLWPAAAVALGEVSEPRIIRIAEKLEHFLYRKAGQIIAVTQGFCKYIRSVGIASEKICWIPNGTVTDIFHPKRTDKHLRRRLGLNGKLVVTFAGTHGIAQGLPAVIETARLLAQRSDIVFLLIGEGPVKPDLIRLARAYALKNVIFHPQVPLEKITPYLNMSDILLVPLKNDEVFNTFIPSKMFDFMACAKPVLLSVPGEARAILEKARAGLFVEPENPSAMSRAILNMCQNPTLAQQMGENGKKYIYKAGYIRAQQARDLYTIIERLVSGSSDISKIRVLRMIARLNIGGPAIHVALLTHGLDPTRFQSTLIAGKVSPLEGDMSYIIDASDGKPIIISKLQRELSFIKDVKSFFSFLRILDQEKPDIVHTHTAKAGAIGRIAVFVHNVTHRRNVRVVHTFHGHVFRGYFGKLKSVFFAWAERMLAKITDCIIAISESQKSELCGNYHIAPASKFRVIPLGFDLAPFLTCKAETYQKSEVRSQKSEVRGQRAEDREQRTEDSGQWSVVSGQKTEDNLEMASPEWKIGIVGRLVAIKNHKMFLKSAKIFLDKNPDKDVKFVVIGDGELRNDLMRYCEDERLSDRVVFCGWRKDLQNVYADLDILALTSINEGTPVSIVEAMACSVPVISTDAGGVRGLIGECAPGKKASRFTGQGVRSVECGIRTRSKACANAELTTKAGEFEVCERGILVKQGDAEGLAEGLKYLVENHTRLKKEMSGRARLFVEQNFSKERLVQDIESLYVELMGPQITRIAPSR